MDVVDRCSLRFPCCTITYLLLLCTTTGVWRESCCNRPRKEQVPQVLISPAQSIEPPEKKTSLRPILGKTHTVLCNESTTTVFTWYQGKFTSQYSDVSTRRSHTDVLPSRSTFWPAALMYVYKTWASKLQSLIRNIFLSNRNRKPQTRTLDQEQKGVFRILRQKRMQYKMF